MTRLRFTMPLLAVMRGWRRIALALGLASAATAVHVAPQPRPGEVCGGDGWCWYHPLPQGAQLDAVWGAAWNDVWAGGRDGVLHFDGARWHAVPIPIAKVRSLWGSGPRDVWAGGEGIARWNGTSWRVVRGLPETDDVGYLLAGSGPRDVWALADAGDGPEETQAILHWNGARWSRQWGPMKPVESKRSLTALWAGRSGDVWAAGADVGSKSALLLHRTSAGWTKVDTPRADWLLALWGAGADDLWAAGGETLLHWNGREWSSARAPQGATLRALWGVSSSSVWAAGSDLVLHWDGVAWSRQWTNAGASHLVRAGWSSGPRDAWAAGDGGLLLHYDGASWSGADRLDLRYLTAVGGDSSGDAWAVGGYGAAVRYDGSRWSLVPTPTREPLYGVWVGSPRDALAVGSSGNCDDFVLRWDGARWSYAYGPVHGGCLMSIWGTDATHAWAAGMRGLLRWDGKEWSPFGPADAARSVWASAASDVWALQDSTAGGATPPGGVYRWDGTRWTLLQTQLGMQLHAIWGSASDDVWVVGDSATNVAHWDGARWSVVRTGLSGSPVGLAAIWGSAPDDVWAAGPGLPILHWDGTRWRARPDAEVRSVSGLGGGGHMLWAVGGTDGILGRALGARTAPVAHAHRPRRR